MKIAIIGGGISGLSTAYYLKKFLLPISEIIVFEGSSRFGGWMQTKKVKFGNDEVYFDKGPRTFRLSTSTLKEINSIQMAKELGLQTSIDLVSKKHPASLFRYIYYNNKINKVETNPFAKSPLMNKRLISYIWNEYNKSPRDQNVEDESIWSFISRRMDSNIADNLVDPVFKGICGGDIKQLSAEMLLRQFYKYEKEFGSISKGMFGAKKAEHSQRDEMAKYNDLLSVKGDYRDQSVWRLKYGSEELIERLVQFLSKEDNVKLHLNEPIEKLEIDESKAHKSINLKSKKKEEKNIDIVISSVYSQNNSKFLPERYSNLIELLNKIPSVNMVLINFYFKTDILPVKGFGYLVPTNQNSPILGCIFDSIFNEPTQKNTVLTVMMGGEWYDQYFGNKNENEIYQIGVNELKKQLNLSIDPDYHEISILKNAIPQYKVGHQKILNDINSCLENERLSQKFYVTGYSYEGVGVNDCIFNARNLVQNVLTKNSLIF